MLPPAISLLRIYSAIQLQKSTFFETKFRNLVNLAAICENAILLVLLQTNLKDEFLQTHELVIVFVVILHCFLVVEEYFLDLFYYPNTFVNMKVKLTLNSINESSKLNIFLIMLRNIR